MDFTITFLKLFFINLYFAGPLLVSFTVVILLSGLWVGKQEQWSCGDSLYWSFVTATTVGYGDFKPAKPLTKFVAVLIAFIGLLFTGLLVALALHAATGALSEHVDREKYETLEQKVKIKADPQTEKP